MAVPTGVMPELLEGVYSEDPILPEVKEVSLLDIVNPSQYSALGMSNQSVDPIQQGLQEFAQQPTSIQTLSAPRFFDYEGAQTDRYKQSEYFNSIGFDPTLGPENEYRYGARQTWGDVWGNGLSGMFKLAGNTFIEGWKGWSNLAEAVYSDGNWWNADKLMGTADELAVQDKATKDILNKYAIFATPESEEGVFNRKFFGDMLQQSGFAVGAIAQFLSEELLTWGLSTEFSLAKLGMKSPGWVGRVVTKADIAEDLVDLGSPIWKSKTLSEGLVQGARKFIPFVDTGYSLAKYSKAGAGALQMASIGVGGVRRFLSEANMAMTEARMEAAGTYGELYNKMYDEELRKTGEAPDPVTLEKIRKNSMDAAYDNFKVNSGILLLSNRLQFDNVLSKFGVGRSVFGAAGEYADDVLRVSGRKVGQEAGERTMKAYVKGNLGTIGLLGDISKDFGKRTAAWEATKSLGRNLFKWETSEGIQELLQEGSNKALTDYYYDLYHGVEGGNITQYAQNAMSEQANIEGLKTFLMGAVTGRLLSPINFTVGKLKEYGTTTSIQREVRKKSIDDAVNMVNAFYENPNNFLNEHIANVKVQNKAAKNMEEAIRNRDQYEFTNNKDGAFAKMISAAIKTDMFKAVSKTIREYGDAFNDEEFKQAFGIDRTEQNIRSVKEYFNKIADETESFHKTWNELKDRFGDLVMTDIYKEGTPERRIALRAKRALDDALEILATNNYRATRNAERATKLQVEMASIPVLGSSVASAFRTLGVLKNTSKELELLRQELKSLEAQPTPDKATKDLIKSKKAQIKSLEDWQNNHESFKNLNVKQKRKFKKASKAFEDYIRSKNLESGIDQEIKLDELDGIYEKLIDYIELNTDYKEYIDAYNILANPIQFVKVHARLMSAIKDTAETFKDEHKKEIINEQKGKSPIDGKTPGTIGTHTVRKEVNGTYSVISPSGNIVAKDIATEADAILLAKENDEALAAKGRSKGLERPEGLADEAVVLKYQNNIYLIEHEDEQGDKFYYIVDSKNQPVGIKLDDRLFPSYNPNNIYDTVEDADKIYEALQKEVASEYLEFEFDGKKIKFGDILVDGKNKKYKVITKGKPVYNKGKDKYGIIIKPLSGSIATFTIYSLSGYNLESTVPPSMEPEDPNAFRLQRDNELVRVYGARRDGESQEEANERLRAIILSTPKQDLSNGISIRVTKNTSLGPVSFASYQDGSGENKRLQQNPEPYMVEIIYGGETIGFATHYNRYSYVNSDGTIVRLDKITKSEFVQIFDTGTEDQDKVYKAFKQNFKNSMDFHTELAAKLGDQDSVLISSDEASKLFMFTPSPGEYAFAPREARVAFNDLDYTTVDGFTYILDRRTRYLGDGMYEEDPRVQTDALDAEDIEKRIQEARFEGGEDKLKFYGRYVAVVELPNGLIRFVELQTPPVDRVQLDDLVDKINRKSKELKENNLEEKTDTKTGAKYFSSRNPAAADDVNSEIDNLLYITVGNRRGMRVNLQLLPTGNLQVEFAVFYKGSKKPVKRKVYIQQSEGDSTIPLQIKNASELIERLNEAIAEHDNDPKNATQKLGLAKFTLDNFKLSLDEDASISEYRQMLAGTMPSVVRNEGLYFRKKPKDGSFPKDTIATGSRPSKKEGTKSSKSSKEPDLSALDGIIIPDDIAAQQAEFLKRRKKEKEAGDLSPSGDTAGEKTIQEQIQDLMDEKDQIIIAKEKEFMKPVSEGGQGMTRKEAMKFKWNTLPEIAAINRKIAELNGGAALMIADTLNEENVEDIDTFTNWVKENLPEFISIEELTIINRKMKEEGITVGMFYIHVNELRNQLEGKIAVNKDSPGKYHEAFHAVFRMLLTNEEINKFYAIARQELFSQGKNIADLKKQLYASKPSVYGKLSDKELEYRVYEEYLANKFDDWKRNIKTPTSATNKGLFRRILDFIRAFFKRLTASPLDQLFSSIDKGKFKNSSVVKNRFTTESNISISEPALLSVKVGTRVITNEDGQKEIIPVYLSQEEGDKLVSTIAAIYHMRMQKAGLNTHSEDVMDDILADYLNLYDLETNPYYESDEFIERYEEGGSVMLEKIREKINQRARIFRNEESREILKKAIRIHTTIMGYKDQAEAEAFDDMVDEYGDRVTTDNWKETYSIGGYGSLSKELRQYLATIVEEKTDDFGNRYFIKDDGTATEEPLLEAVNANMLYNGLLKAVSGSANQEQVLERMRIFAQHNSEARKFWNRFSQDVDLIYDEDSNFVDIGNKDNANLFQSVVKGFMQFSVDNYFINKDLKSKESRIIEANKQGAAKNQFSIWYNAYLNLFVDQLEDVPTDSLAGFIKKKTSGLDKLAVFLKAGNKYSASVVNEQITAISENLANELGIKLSPLFLRYSYLSKINPKDRTAEENRVVAAFDSVEPMTEEDAREIASVIRDGKNPFGSNIDPDKLAQAEEQRAALAHEIKKDIDEDEDTEEEDLDQDVEDDVDGAVGRLTKIATANAVFDEQVSTTSYKNAENEVVYAHQLPTFNLVRTAQLQDPEFRKKLLEDPFLATNYLLNNPDFDFIADNIKIGRIGGIKDSSLKRNERGDLIEDKRLNVNQNEGVTYGSMSDREFLISLFELYANNKNHIKSDGRVVTTSSVLLGVIEATNTADVLNLPVIRSVETVGGKLSLTKNVKEILLNEVKREYERITRVQQEITTGEYKKGIIEGYHTGDFNSDGMRGLKFIKMKNMLGELATRLQEAAKANEDFEQFNDEILTNIEKYWVGPGGQIDRMIDIMQEQNMISIDPKTGEIKNKLLNRYLFSGFKNKANKFDRDRTKNLFIENDNPRKNIAQVVLNNFVNTLSARQLYIGDAAENFKDDGGIDEVKRNRGLNGSGPSSYSMITAENLGIFHKNEKSHVVTFNDPKYKGKYAGKNKEKADAQMWLTVKALRYTLFGFGKLNKAQAELLDKIEKGESVVVDDIFGELYKDETGKTRRRGGSIAYNAQTNSIKLVYNDGQKYIKTSGVILSKELTSIWDGKQWNARPGYEELHTLRDKLEEFEARNQTIAMAIPKSASKGLKTNVAKDIDSIGDNNFIEHDNNFWRLQLENPSNKNIITDPTQAKQLLIAEQSRDLIVNFQGKQMSLGDVIDQYLKDTEQRIKNNYFMARDRMFTIEDSFRELGKSLKQDKITPELGTFLKNAVKTLASTGADAQLLEFFQPLIDPNTGRAIPKYNLNNNITLDKFTQLFLAYFSKGVMSEKVPGHSVALMSNYGVKVVKRVLELDDNGQPKRWVVITRRQYEQDADLFTAVKNAKRWNNDLDREFSDLTVGDFYIDDLRHNVPEYNSKGEITGYFSEYMMPPHFREHMNQYNNDGSIAESAKKMFAVRIPSQDKHSFVTGKLVDFLPAYYGSTGVFPHELVEISGADFDIDKLYMQIMDSYSRKGKLVPYGTAVSNKDKFAEFVMYMSTRDKLFKDKMNELFSIKPAEDDPDTIYGDLETTAFYADMDDLLNDLNDSVRNVVIRTALKELGLPSNEQEYADKVKDGIEYNNGVLNNRILEAKILMLSNEKTVESEQGNIPIAFQVAEVQPLLDVIDNFKVRFPILHDILIETGTDVDSMIGQYMSFKNNKEGARNIGPAVNAMLVYALMNSYNVNIRKQNSKGDDLFVLRIDGNDFDSYQYTKAFVKKSEIGPDGELIESPGEYSGERIFYTISALVSAMTDNAKERLAARLGLNINAVGVVANMVALGVPLETAIMFNLQPSVREFYKRIAITSKNIKTNDEANIRKSTVGKDIIEELEKEAGGGSTQDYEITTDLLEKNIKSNGSNSSVNLFIFRNFLSFYEQTEFYSAVAGVLKLSKGLGTSNEDIEKVDKKEEMLGFNMSSIEFGESKIPFDLRQILTGKNPYLPHHHITATYIKIKNQIKELQKSVFLEKTWLFERMKETVLANLNINKKEQESFNKTLKRDLISYLSVKAYMQQLKTKGKQAKLAGLDNAMIYDVDAVRRGEGFLDIIDTIRSIREQLPNNYFANKFLNIRPVKLIDLNTNKPYINPKAKAGINVAESNTWAKLSGYEQNKLEDSFMEIYANPKTRMLAYNLFNYLIVKDGGQFKSNSFIKFIPPALFSELMEATGAAHDLLKLDDQINNDERYKELFGMTSQEMFNEFTSLYSTNVNNKFNIPYILPNKRVDKSIEDTVPKSYVPEVMAFSKDKSMLKLDLFGGIRKPEMMLLEDEYGNEFYAEAVATGSFSPEEMDKLNYNKELLKARGFKLVNKPDDQGNNRYFIALPLTIKVNQSTTLDSKNFVYYKLTSVGKSKKTNFVEGSAAMITRKEVRENPTTLYLFGDNDRRFGLGGQAKEMRGEPNTVGISTKKRPSNDPDAFKSDAELEENKKIITADIERALMMWRSGKYDRVVIPTLGVGLAKLPEKAPETYAFLQQELSRFKKEVNEFQKLTGVGTFIKDINDTIALSNTAIYEKFEPLGSTGQTRIGGMFGELPENKVIRNRKVGNNPLYALDNMDPDAQLAELDRLLGVANLNLDPRLTSETAYELNTQWGIYFNFKGGKLTFTRQVNGKMQPYATDAKSPEELLQMLKMSTPEIPETSGGVFQNVDKPRTENSTENKDEKTGSSTALPNFDGLDNIERTVSPEEAKKFEDFIAARKKLKKEIDDRKKEDDAGCDSPL